MMRTTMSLVFCAFAAVCIAGADDPESGANVIATDGGPLVVHPIEHATFVIEWGGKTIAVDPVGGAEAFADFQGADLILITDIHGDHLSNETVSAVATPSTTVIAPGAVVEKMPEADRGRVTVLANGAATNWQGLTIEAVPMYNLDSEKQAFHPKGRGNGYVVSDGSTRIYISGDTEDIPEMRTLEDIDIAFVCMNLPYTMDVAAAADAVLEFEPKIVFPYHFRGTDGMSDIDKFSTLVAVNPAIDVRVLAWY